MSLSLKLLSGENKRENVQNATIFTGMWFSDSFRFLDIVIEKFVSFLPHDEVEILASLFTSNHSDFDIEILLQKGFTFI